MGDGTGSVVLELTGGPGGRLDRMTWALAVKREAPSLRVRYEARVRFTGWNDPVDISAPGPAEFDLTPGVNEEDLAGVEGMTVLAPRSLHDGSVLSRGRVYGDYDDDYRADCDVVALGYDGPRPSVHLSMSSTECAETKGRRPRSGSRPFVAGPHRGWVTKEAEDYGGNIEVVLEIDGTVVEVSSGLSEADLIPILASLAPLDLATTPVQESRPGGG